MNPVILKEFEAHYPDPWEAKEMANQYLKSRERKQNFIKSIVFLLLLSALLGTVFGFLQGAFFESPGILVRTLTLALAIYPPIYILYRAQRRSARKYIRQLRRNERSE